LQTNEQNENTIKDDVVTNSWNLGCAAYCKDHKSPTAGRQYPFKANINLVFIVVVKPPKSLTKPMVSGIFLTQKVSTTNQHPSFHLQMGFCKKLPD
jgi:hypothetical protein